MALVKGILWAVLQQPIAVLPIFNQGSPHHITLFYDVDSTQYRHLIGTEFEADAIAYQSKKCFKANLFLGVAIAETLVNQD